VYLEDGIARNGIYANGSMMAGGYDAISDIQAKPGPLTDRLGSEKGIENARLYGGRNARSRVADLDLNPIPLRTGAEG
jgi:hypothetical protein